jgi:hypothetical protein
LATSNLERSSGAFGHNIFRCPFQICTRDSKELGRRGFAYAQQTHATGWALIGATEHFSASDGAPKTGD